MGYLYQVLNHYLLATGKQNGDEGLRSIILVGQGLLVKMLITLEPCGIF